jgi:hypothetical protein
LCDSWVPSLSLDFWQPSHPQRPSNMRCRETSLLTNKELPVPRRGQPTSCIAFPAVNLNGSVTATRWEHWKRKMSCWSLLSWLSSVSTDRCSNKKAKLCLYLPD